MIAPVALPTARRAAITTSRFGALALGVALLAAALGTGCTTRSGGGEASGGRKDGFEPATAETLSPFRDKDLRLVRLVQNGSKVALGGTAITLKLGEGGKIAGRSAVNRYFGKFDLTPSGELQWPPAALGMTRMAGPAEAMELEAKYTQVLTATTRLAVSGEAVRFSSADGSQVAEFER